MLYMLINNSFIIIQKFVSSIGWHPTFSEALLIFIFHLDFQIARVKRIGIRVPKARKISCGDNFRNHYLMDICVLCWIKSLNYLWRGLLWAFSIQTLLIFIIHLKLMPSLIWRRFNLDWLLMSPRKSLPVKHRVITVLNWYRVDLCWSEEIYLILRSLR
jgi:hypothetical protein